MPNQEGGSSIITTGNHDVILTGNVTDLRQEDAVITPIIGKDLRGKPSLLTSQLSALQDHIQEQQELMHQNLIKTITSYQNEFLYKKNTTFQRASIKEHHSSLTNVIESQSETLRSAFYTNIQEFVNNANKTVSKDFDNQSRRASEVYQWTQNEGENKLRRSRVAHHREFRKTKVLDRCLRNEAIRVVKEACDKKIEEISTEYAANTKKLEKQLFKYKMENEERAEQIQKQRSANEKLQHELRNIDSDSGIISKSKIVKDLKRQIKSYESKLLQSKSQTEKARLELQNQIDLLVKSEKSVKTKQHEVQQVKKLLKEAHSRLQVEIPENKRLNQELRNANHRMLVSDSKAQVSLNRIQNAEEHTKLVLNQLEQQKQAQGSITTEQNTKELLYAETSSNLMSQYLCRLQDRAQYERQFIIQVVESAITNSDDNIITAVREAYDSFYDTVTCTVTWDGDNILELKKNVKDLTATALENEHTINTLEKTVQNHKDTEKYLTLQISEKDMLLSELTNLCQKQKKENLRLHGLIDSAVETSTSSLSFRRRPSSGKNAAAVVPIRRQTLGMRPMSASEVPAGNLRLPRFEPTLGKLSSGQSTSTNKRPPTAPSQRNSATQQFSEFIQSSDGSLASASRTRARFSTTAIEKIVDRRASLKP